VTSRVRQQSTEVFVQDLYSVYESEDNSVEEHWYQGHLRRNSPKYRRHKYQRFFGWYQL